MDPSPSRSSRAAQAETGAGRYAAVNRLNMYYEVHGAGQPLVLLHGSLSAIGTSFGKILPGLARTRQVIAVEQQGHGRTADVERPLTVQQMAEDTIELLGQIAVGKADFFGYSIGAAIAFQIAVQRPDLVRKLVAASLTYTVDGFHPGLLEGIEDLKPEMLQGTPFQQEYADIAPDPKNWPVLIEKTVLLDRDLPNWTPETVSALQPPAMLIIGDSDIVRPEHAVEFFRLLGGGVPGDNVGLPKARLAVLPGTTHVTLPDRADWIVPMVNDFLDAPIPPSPSK